MKPATKHQPVGRNAARVSWPALVLAVAAWAAGCGTTPAMVEPAFAARTYTPARISVLPPDVFFVYDDLGDNDPQKSAALGQAVAQQSGALLAETLQRRGYQVDFSARWDGVYGPDGRAVVPREELAFFANSVLGFANSEAGGGEGPFKQPVFIAPEAAARLGAATSSDALLYVNMKGVSVSGGKRTAQVVGVVFFVVVIAAIVLLMMADSKGGGGRSVPTTGGTGGTGVARAAAPAGATQARWGGGVPGAAAAAPVGYGARSFGGGGHTYRSGPNVGLGVGVMVPLGGPVHTHEGQVADEDSAFAGDDLNFSITLVSSSDGRVLWHKRQNVDFDAERPEGIKRFWEGIVAEIPPSLAVQAKAAPAAAGSQR